MASSSRPRSSSPFSYRRPSTPYTSTTSSSSSSSSSNPRLFPRSSSNSFQASFPSRSITPSRNTPDSSHSVSRGYDLPGGPVPFPPPDELVAEQLDGPRSADSISVTIRFRPLSEREYQRGDEIAWYADGDKLVRHEYNPATAFAFDKVFGPHSTSQEVYEVAAKPVVKAAMEGVNGTVFAYGVTSSGKTHTMHGDHNCPGIIPLAIKDVFSMIQDTPGREFLLRVSYLEIYNEVINDLLDPTGQNLRVREDAQGTYVEGIKEEVVLSPGHALSFIAAGEEHRHVGSNNFNLLSSRSHTIFTLMIESSAPGDEYDGVIFSQLNLIDLAGSESSKTETTGLRRKEGSYINKSLLTLGTVIGKLSEGKASHVPYRDSKLTRLLQSSLSGHGHVSLICTVTPASSNMEETHNTLKFASRAKRVEIFASRNKIIDEKSLIKKYQKEITNLKQELDQLRSGMVVGVSHEEILNLRQQLEEGQVKMQTRLEEEEEAKAALLSRIQRLTKLILVSSKNAMPGGLADIPNHQRSHSTGEDECNRLLLAEESRQIFCLCYGIHCLSTVGTRKILQLQTRSTLLIHLMNPNIRDHPARGAMSFHLLLVSSANQHKPGELICGTKLPGDGISASDQMDLLVEQVKMLAGEIAFGTSTMKRLIEQSVNDPEGSKVQIQNLERELQEKRRQMRMLEQRLSETGEASVANASIVEMQQTVTRLMAKCNEKSFELEIKSADNRILQEQLQTKCSENKELVEKVNELERQLASANSDRTAVPCEHNGLGDYAKELEEKIKIQEIENMKLKREHRVPSDDFDALNLDPDDLKIELQARKQREEALETALAEKDFLEDEYRKKVEEAKMREQALENDLANMWVLVAKLKKDGGGLPELNPDKKCDELINGTGLMSSEVDFKDVLRERQISDVPKSAEEPNKEPLVVRLKAQMKEMKEKELKSMGNGNGISHVCKVCFESPTAAILLPCRHFCLCKSCSLACSECPICRTKIGDRLFAFAS
ncbi:hypothetical protein MLD38_013868 [Melastoma candidum]|uniref:Uncharacterized protein n=1 Tax=Melastoma candidum TaxID=119954 RepID=A0ACB9RB13_9MYRT|nr:hypothetical protein MLD38_013868 [Melastoma candidum]